LLISAQKSVTGVAFDPSYAWTLATARYPDDRKKYPELGFGVGITNFGGLPASVSNTVSGRPEATDTGVRAIIGDFASGIRWGVQRAVAAEPSRVGGADGQGGLRRQNRMALRREIVDGWYVFTDGFAVSEEGD